MVPKVWTHVRHVMFYLYIFFAFIVAMTACKRAHSRYWKIAKVTYFPGFDSPVHLFIFCLGQVQRWRISTHCSVDCKRCNSRNICLGQMKPAWHWSNHNYQLKTTSLKFHFKSPSYFINKHKTSRNHPCFISVKRLLKDHPKDLTFPRSRDQDRAEERRQRHSNSNLISKTPTVA